MSTDSPLAKPIMTNGRTTNGGVDFTKLENGTNGTSNGDRPGSPSAASIGSAVSTCYTEDFEDFLLVKPKKKKAGIELTNTMPDPGSFQFYAENMSLMHMGSPEMDELVDAKMKEGHHFFATHKSGFDYLTKKGAKQGKIPEGDTKTEMWLIHQAKEAKQSYQRILEHNTRGFIGNESDWYFVGRKIDGDSALAVPLLVISVDELWLKSAYHQKEMYKCLCQALARCCPDSYIVRAGNGLIHIRVAMPSKEQLDLAGLIPGVNLICKPNEENPNVAGEPIRVGPGGVPQLNNQKALCLMSGGIDSPVSAYRMMTRGVNVNGVHYLNSTSDTGAVLAKNRKLAARLSEIQGAFTLRFVDINELQMAIVGNVGNCNRTLVYKWFMLHLSSILDTENKVLVTGDSLGQVASQTLQNISSLYPGLRKPVMPPLMGMNKREIIDEAKKIGTFNLSIIQAADCCQFMMRKTNANVSIDQWTLFGEIAKVLRNNLPQFLPVTVDTFRNGELTETREEKFPLGENINVLFEIIDVKGRMGLNKMIGYRRDHKDSEQSDHPMSAAEMEQEEVLQKAAKKVTKELKAEAYNAANGGGTSSQSLNGGGPVSKEELAKKFFGSEEPSANGIPAKIESKHQDPAVAPSEKKTSARKAVYHFDAAAATVICKEAAEATLKAPEGNPSSLHASGRASRAAIEKVRAQLAAMIGKPASNIIFTSGGTESNSIALNGCTVERDSWSHSSTKESSSSSSSSSSGTVVRVVDLVHHETGSIATNEMLKRPVGPANARLHVDACQALGKIKFKHFDLSEVDTMTFNSHKIHGPSGVGALYVRDLSSLKPLFVGGSQEFGLRPGTENVAGIVGFGVALSMADAYLNTELEAASTSFKEKIVTANPVTASGAGGGITPGRLKIENFVTSKLKSIGCEINKRGQTIGYIVHATLPPNLKLENSDIVNTLSSQHQVEIGTGSACNSAVENVTTYETLGVTPVPKRRSIRLSWDRYTTMEDAEYVLSAVETVIAQNRPKGQKQ